MDGKLSPSSCGRYFHSVNFIKNQVCWPIAGPQRRPQSVAGDANCALVQDYDVPSINDVFDVDDKYFYDYLNYLMYEKLCDINYIQHC